MARTDLLRALEGVAAALARSRRRASRTSSRHRAPAPRSSRPSRALGDRADGVYLVGGTVRDILLGEESFDVDIAVEGDAIEFA